MKQITLILMLILISPAFGQTLSGGIHYNIEDAKIELQNNKPSSAFLLTAENFDTNFEENQSYLLKGVTELKDRTLAKFSDSTYGVNYKNDIYHVWYYDKDGMLINAEIKTSPSYPYRTYKYDIDGQLVSMSMRVSERETFIFNPLGQLLGHWVGEKCYDENGKVLMTRKIFK